MPYVTVFDISQKPFQWWWTLYCLLFVAIGILLIKSVARRTGRKDVKFVGWFFVVFASFLSLIVFASTYSEYRDCLDAYHAGNYSTVEGTVEKFIPMAYEGHQDECFRVQGESFCYSDYTVEPGFNQSSSHGGPLRAGLPVRIAFLDKHILRLEIRADSVPLGAERSAYATAEQANSKALAENNPYWDHMLLGFNFSMFVVALCWNLDWGHYMRYWITRGPPYSRFWQIVFRSFFLACLIGASTGLVQKVREKPRSKADFGLAALDSLIWVGFFAVVDLSFRWRLRKKKQSAAILL